MVVARLVACLICLTWLAVPAVHGAADDVDKEVARWTEDVAKAKKSFETDIGKANEKAEKALTALAKRLVKAGDNAGAANAWKAVLAIDRDAVEARDYFTALGRLDEVLDEIVGTGDPLAAENERRALVFSPGALIWPGGNVLTSAFAKRTVELTVGQARGDGVLYEEGDARNGMAVALVGDQVRFTVGIDGSLVELKGAFDRAQPWTHIAAQFAPGEISLWIDGKPAQRARAPLDGMPEHRAEAAIGGERRGSVAGMPKNALSFRLALFRLSDAARFATAFTPPRDAVTDATTLLAIGSANLADALATVPAPKPDEAAKPGKKNKNAAAGITMFADLGNGNIRWSVAGDVGVR